MRIRRATRAASAASITRSSRAALAALALGVAAACAPADPPPPPAARAPAPPPQPPVFAPERSYAAVTVSDDGAEGVPLAALCDVTQTRSYRLRHNRAAWPTCAAREVYIGLGVAEDAEVEGLRGGERWRLEDGRLVEFWPLISVGPGADRRLLQGAYVLAAQNRGDAVLEAMTGVLPAYRLRPGRIHYLGVWGPDRRIVARDVAGFADAFAASFPDIDPDRIERSAATGFTVDCAPFTARGDDEIRGFDCTGRRRGDPFGAQR